MGHRLLTPPMESAPPLRSGFLGVFLAWVLANPAPTAAVVASLFTAWAMWQRGRAEKARAAFYATNAAAASPCAADA